MIEVTKIIEFDMGHRVPNHKSKCRNPHGHRYRLEVSVSGPVINTSGVSDEGMVIDFGDIKEIIKVQVHDHLDHGFMVYSGDTIMKPLLVDEANGRQGCDFRVIEVPFIPTAENLVRFCADRIIPHLPPGLVLSRLRLFETPNSWADYIPG